MNDTLHQLRHTSAHSSLRVSDCYCEANHAVMEPVNANSVVIVKVNYVWGKFWLKKLVVHMADCTADTAILALKQVATDRTKYINPEACLCEDYSNNQFQSISGDRLLSTVAGDIYFSNITPKTNFFDRLWLWSQMTQEERNTQINAGRVKPWCWIRYSSAAVTIITRLFIKKKARVEPSPLIQRRVQFTEDAVEIISQNEDRSKP